MEEQSLATISEAKRALATIDNIHDARGLVKLAEGYTVAALKNYNQVLIKY